MTVVPFPPRSTVPEHRRAVGTALEQAQAAVVNRVASAIHMAGAENMPGYPTWQEFVDAAYENAETNPEMLEVVSRNIRNARADIAALAPCEPHWDEAIFHDIGGDTAELCSTVQDWISAVLK